MILEDKAVKAPRLCQGVDLATVTQRKGRMIFRTVFQKDYLLCTWTPASIISLKNNGGCLELDWIVDGKQSTIDQFRILPLNMAKGTIDPDIRNANLILSLL